MKFDLITKLGYNTNSRRREKRINPLEYNDEEDPVVEHQGNLEEKRLRELLGHAEGKIVVMTGALERAHTTLQALLIRLGEVTKTLRTVKEFSLIEESLESKVTGLTTNTTEAVNKIKRSFDEAILEIAEAFLMTVNKITCHSKKKQNELRK